MNATLFNCCTGNVAPDWTQYDALEIGGVRAPEDARDVCEGGVQSFEADFWTVYAHRIDGGVDAITDVTTRKLANLVADKLSKETGLPVTVR